MELENKPGVNANTLEYAVLTRTPWEVAELCKDLREGENSCRALGLACRYRGMEYVKALVENGATFRYIKPENNMGGYYTIYYWLSPLEQSRPLRRAYFTNSDTCFSNEAQLANANGDIVKTIPTLPIEERAEIVKYLCENSERLCFEPGELLYYSIMSRSKKITAVLKEMGVTFTEKRIAQLTENGRSFEWMEFCNMQGGYDDDGLLEVLTELAAELGGKKFHYTDSIYWENYNPYRKVFRFFKPAFFRFILDNFNQKKMNKTQLMKGAINQNNVEGLALCAENGWLKQPRKRDEIIEYATKNDKAECVAWLLDFKNRTADLAAEREKAEKKAERELNADPNSMTELKKIWGFEKQEDGTLIITRYKGKRTEITVPSVIGKSAVTAIGEYAFSPRASRITQEQRRFRETITKIKLPDGIRSIGKGAFYQCFGLEDINIPDGVAEIGDSAFAICNRLTEIVIPETVVKMGNGMFGGCTKLRSMVLPKSITEIGTYMFSNCKALKSITLPAALQTIRNCAFIRCDMLEEIVIPEGTVEIEKHAFAYCEKLKNVVIPASVGKMKNITYSGRKPETVFHKSDEVTATVEPKSYAEKYCKRNEIKYIYKEQDDR